MFVVFMGVAGSAQRLNILNHICAAFGKWQDVIRHDFNLGFMSSAAQTFIAVKRLQFAPLGLGEISRAIMLSRLTQSPMKSSSIRVVFAPLFRLLPRLFPMGGVVCSVLFSIFFGICQRMQSCGFAAFTPMILVVFAIVSAALLNATRFVIMSPLTEARAANGINAALVPLTGTHIGQSFPLTTNAANATTKQGTKVHIAPHCASSQEDGSQGGVSAARSVISLDYRPIIARNEAESQ